jgi:predicted metal-dependent hydrolase
VTQAFQFRRPEGVQVTYRRMKFDFEDQGFDRYWHGASAFKSLFWTQLSTAFEPGETFFIDSARALRKQLDDPKLLEELTEFCKQEGHHTAQHLKFDRINASLGVDVDGCRARYARVLNWCRRTLPPIEMLATTVALEHFTSCFADQYFTNRAVSEGADPKVLALWAWHAAEESEHRGTCFDIYKALGGKYLMRLSHLIGAWSIILGLSMINTAILLQRDGKLFSRDTLRGLGYLFGRKGVVTGLLPAFFSFFSPRFHPWRGVSGADIGRWARDNQRYVTNVSDAA